MLARLFSALVLAATSALASAPAQALSFSDEGGGVARLSGRFDEGDEKEFAAFLAKPRAAPLRVLYLSSGGGAVYSAIEIGRMVRRAGIANAVEADKTFCDSACTLVFVSGRQRHYVNASGVREGFTDFYGLGFHFAHNRGYGAILSAKSDRGTQAMRDFYAEMGVPAASVLAQRAGVSALYRPAAQTALSTRIATSLSAPGGAAGAPAARSR